MTRKEKMPPDVAAEVGVRGGKAKPKTKPNNVRVLQSARDKRALRLRGAEDAAKWTNDEPIVCVGTQTAFAALRACGLRAVMVESGDADAPLAREVLSGREVTLWSSFSQSEQADQARFVAEVQESVAHLRLYEDNKWRIEKGLEADAADHPLVANESAENTAELKRRVKEARVLEGDELRRYLNFLENRQKGVRKERGKRPHIITATDLMAADLGEVQWIIPDILPEGLTLLVGKAKMRKSFMALGACLAIAAGGMALGKIRVEQGSSLYLALEDNHRRLKKRMGDILKGAPPPEKFFLANEWPRLDEGGLDYIVEWLESTPDARLVVIDTMVKIRPPAKGKNIYSEDYHALEALIPVASRFGVSILVVHHFNKMADAQDPLDAISGSTGLTGGVDGFLLLKRDRGSADAYLYVDGRDIEEPRELALQWDPNITGWSLMGDAETFRLSTERQAIIRVLENADGPLRPQEVAEALDKKPGAVREMMGQMEKQGYLHKPSYGLYAVSTTQNIPDSPDAAATTDSPDTTDSSSAPPVQVSGNGASVRVSDTEPDTSVPGGSLANEWVAPASVSRVRTVRDNVGEEKADTYADLVDLYREDAER